MRVVALHLTKPSNSEANVLSKLLRHVADDIEISLILNREGLGDLHSFFADRAAIPSVRLCPMNVGLPIDPQEPRPLRERMAWRARHLVHREVVVRKAVGLRPDLVYTSQQRFDCRIGEAISRRLHVPHVVHLHYVPGAVLGKRAMDRLRSCDRVLAVSAFIGRLAEGQGVDPRRIVLLPNTIDVPGAADGADATEGVAASKARPRTGFTVGQTGRMAPGKGFEDSLHAFARLKRELPDSNLVFVGDGSLRPSLERTAVELGLAESVLFVGWQSEVRRWLGTFDVFVCPSRSEPFGLAALEASAAGLPVVGYDEGGVGEIVVDGETGLLAPPGDVPALTQALLRLGGDEALRATLGRAARSRATRAFNPVEAAGVFSRVLREEATRARPKASRAGSSTS